MKKSLITAFIFTILALISLPFALLKINAGKNQITITQEILRGDPAAAAGITLQVRAHWNRHLLWETEYTTGSEKGAQSKFAFSEKEISWGRDAVVTAGISFPTENRFYGDTDEFGLEAEEKPFSKIIRAAAEKISNENAGHSEIVQIEDFYKYYPVVFEITGHSTYYLGDYNEANKYLTEYFHIPTGKDQLKITVKEDRKNKIFSFEGTILPQKGKFVITGAQFIGENGIYYIYCLTDTETTEGVDRGQNTGIFYFPFKEDQGFWKIDCTKVEKLCEFPYDFTPLKITMDQEEETLFLLARKNKEYRVFIYHKAEKGLILTQELAICQKEKFFSEAAISALEENLPELFSEEIADSTPEEGNLPELFSEGTTDSTPEEGNLPESFSKGEAKYPNEKEKDLILPQVCEMVLKDNSILITWNNGWFSFLTQEENGYQIWCEAKFPETSEEKETGGMPFPWEHTCIFNREKLVLAAFENWYSLNIVLAVYQKQEEVYVGFYRHSAENITATNDIKGKLQPQGARVWKPYSEWYWDNTGEIVEPLEITVK